MKVDYIIVGAGLAGTLFCDLLRKHNKSFVVFDDTSQRSSVVAGGLYNPVVLKRFTPVWKSKEQLDLALPVYKELEELLQVKLDYKIKVLRLFASVEEQNNWFSASDKPGLSEFLSTEIINLKNDYFESPFGFGQVNSTGRIDTGLLIDRFKEYLVQKQALRAEPLQHDLLAVKENKVIYKDVEAQNIVFSEGFGLKQNLFFNYLPLNGTKGELLTIHAPDLKIDFVLKSNVFLIPQEEDHYLVGATYNWNDKTNEPSEEGRHELLSKLKSLLRCEFKIVDQLAGIRPTVIDRRPLVGRHNDYSNIYVLNGLGTRGVMIAPYVANQLFNFIEKQIGLNPEININRFD